VWGEKIDFFNRMSQKGSLNIVLTVGILAVIVIGGFFQKPINPAMAQQPSQQSNKAENKFGIVSFAKDDTSTWPLEWHITLSPEDTQNNEFQITSQLKTEKPVGIENVYGFDKRILSDILVDKREIQPKAGDPVDIKFRLDNDSHANPSGPRGYQYLVMAAGFSRLGGFKHNGTIPVTPYRTSFHIFMLGNKIVDRTFAETGIFFGSKVFIATIKTRDDKSSYTYEIFLEKFPKK